jgi:hypothetical protein
MEQRENQGPQAQEFLIQKKLPLTWKFNAQRMILYVAICAGALLLHAGSTVASVASTVLVIITAESWNTTYIVYVYLYDGKMKIKVNIYFDKIDTQ